MIAGSGPAHDTVRRDSDQWERFEVHRAIWLVLFAERHERSAPLIADIDEVGIAAHLEPGEAGPILVVAVDDETDGRVCQDVADAPERPGVAALWLLVDRGVNQPIEQDEADREGVGGVALVHGGEARYPRDCEEGELVGTEEVDGHIRNGSRLGRVGADRAKSGHRPSVPYDFEWKKQRV
jgi:hypothetical protein